MADCRLGYCILFLIARKKRRGDEEEGKKWREVLTWRSCSLCVFFLLVSCLKKVCLWLQRKEQNRTEYKRIESFFLFFFFFVASFRAMWESADTTASNAAGFNSQTSFYEYPSHKPFVNSVHALRSTQTLSRTVALPESNRDNLLAALKSLTLRIKKLEQDREVRLTRGYFLVPYPSSMSICLGSGIKNPAADRSVVSIEWKTSFDRFGSIGRKTGSPNKKAIQSTEETVTGRKQQWYLRSRNSADQSRWTALSFRFEYGSFYPWRINCTESQFEIECTKCERMIL